jgi:hypothetical protein
MSTSLFLAASFPSSSLALGLTFRQILSELPTDPASVVTVTLLLASLALVVWFGRPRGKGGRPL